MAGVVPPPGFPIRRPRGRRPCAPRPGLSRLAASFVGFQCQGIHRVPLVSSAHIARLLGCILLTIRCDLSQDLRNNLVATLCGSQGTRGRALGTGRCGRGVARRGRRGRLPNSHFFPRKPSLPRKEVIQPHVPVRLPCYDFTPLTLHTFGASPHCWLGRRLRVQTTRVV